jgi:GT2 family glycosyltransferase
MRDTDETIVSARVKPGSATPVVVEVKEPPSLSVIICCYTMDRWFQVQQALTALAAQQLPPNEIIIVVDHCPELYKRATAHFPDAVVVENVEAKGLSGARNSGAAVAQHDIVAFLDDDAAPEPDWSVHLLAAYDDPTVLGVGGLVRARWETQRPNWFPGEFDWVVGCSYRGLPQERTQVRNFIGANMSFRRSILEESGGFRQELGRVGTRPLGCEETELCIRISRQYPDGKFLHEPAAVVRHYVPAQRATWSYFRSRCYSEGLSKAVVTRLAGAGAALSSERSYLRSTIPKALIRPLVPNAKLARLATIPVLLAGVAATGLGYLVGRVRSFTTSVPQTAPQADPPPPATPSP